MENKIITVVENKELIEAIKENMFQWNDVTIEDVNDITITEIFNNVYEVEVENYNYIVSNDYAALEQLATERNVEILDDCGIPENLIFEAEIQGWIDEEYFKDYWEDLHEFQAYNENIQYIATEEELEQLENGDIMEDDIRDNYYNCLKDSLSGNYIDEYKFQFGDKEFQRVLIEHDLIDITALAKWCVEMDGVAHTLATYDGDEIECNGYYIYRAN